MTEARKKELFPYFAYLFSKEMNAERYGSTESVEDWVSKIQANPKDMEAVVTAASQLTDEDWENLEQEYMKLNINDYDREQEYTDDEEVEIAKKGAKLKKLQAMKKGKKMNTKKCCVS